MKTIFFWGLVVALLMGNWILAVCFSVFGLALLCNLGLSLFFPLRPIHESLSRTSVALASYQSCFGASSARGNTPGCSGDSGSTTEGA